MLRENPRVIDLRYRLSQVRTEMQEALAEAARGDVRDYAFGSSRGPVKLSDLFGAQRDLFVIHNMGTTCPNCTMWADGFNGLYPHIADRAAFFVSSPDTPSAQAEFAASRGWIFPMVSTVGSTFAADMGFSNAQGRPQPGVSAFQKDGTRIVRVSAAGFEPQDDFCPVWHLFDLLPQGADGWQARKSY